MEETTGFDNGGGGGRADEDRVVRFSLSPSSALVIQKGDITRWSVDSSSDAIVNPANERMLGGGGADGAIHDASGPELRAGCYNVPEVRRGVRCPTGEARITPGFRLPASHVIHTVGPIYNSNANPEASLRTAYRSSLCLAKQNNIQYIAFPAISCGFYGYPSDEAATIAISTVREFANDFKEVHFVLFSDDIYKVWLKKANKCFKISDYRCLTVCCISTVDSVSCLELLRSARKLMEETTGFCNGRGGRGEDRVVRFSLSPSSALVIQKGNITRWSVDSSSDAIVNPANERMLGGGGADGAIHDASGPELLAACYNVPEVRRGVRCPTGEARITPGFRLPASHVIHTVGPIYNSNANPEASLRTAYRSSLCLAKQNNIQYIAFPAISCGFYGYTSDKAATLAISTVREFANDFKEVHFVLFSDDIYKVWLNKANKCFCFKTCGYRCLTFCCIS